MRPSTSPGASPTHSAWKPSAAKNRCAASAAESGVEGRRVSSTSRQSSSGGSRWKPTACGSPRAASDRSAQSSDQRRPPRAAERRGRAAAPARSRDPARGVVAAARRGRASVDQLRQPAPGSRSPHREAGAAARRSCPRRSPPPPAGLERRRVLRAMRPVAVLVPAAPGLAPEPPGRHHAAPGAGWAASAARRTTARRTTSRPRGRRRCRPGPSARTGPCGSRRRGGRCGRSARGRRSAPAAAAAPRPANGRPQRLTRKPGPSTATITCLPIASPAARATASARSPVCSARITSSSRISGGGLKKCMPTTFSGRCAAPAIAVTGIDEVLVASTVSAPHDLRQLARTARA